MRTVLASAVFLGLCAGVCSAQTTAPAASDPHYYSHYQPYFAPSGTIPSKSTYKPYFPPAYSAPPQQHTYQNFGLRVVDKGAAIDLGHKQAEGDTIDSITGRAKFSYSPPPSTYHGNVWFGYYGGCRAKWGWDPVYHRYTRLGGCI